MDRSRKEQIVSELRTTFNDTNMVVVTQQNGLTVAEASELRRAMHRAGASYRVVKNRLASRALADTPYERLQELFQGPTAVTTSDDPVAAAKTTVNFAKKNAKLVVVGGATRDGVTFDAQGIARLATLPSLDELRSSLLAMIQTPATRLAVLMQEPGAQVARVVNAYATAESSAEESV